MTSLLSLSSDKLIGEEGVEELLAKTITVAVDIGLVVSGFTPVFQDSRC